MTIILTVVELIDNSNIDSNDKNRINDGNDKNSDDNANNQVLHNEAQLDRSEPNNNSRLL